MTTNIAAMPPARPAPREIPHSVSPGLWALAWKRLKSDHVGMVSLAIVVAFFVLMILSAAGLVAKDWSKETGVNYAPPSFVGADVEAGAPAAPGRHRRRSRRRRTPSDVVDPIGDVIAELRGEPPAAPAGTAAAPQPAASRRSSTRSPT